LDKQLRTFFENFFVGLFVLLTMALRIIPAHAMSLQEAREEALRANLHVKISQEKTKQTEMQWRQAYSQFLPVLSLTGSGAYYNNEQDITITAGTYGSFVFGSIPATDVRIPLIDNTLYTAGVKVQQPVFRGGRIYYTYKEYESRTSESLWDEKQIMQDILFNVERAYADLLKAEDLKRVSEQHRNTLAANLADMGKLYKSGRVAYIDVLTVKVEVAHAEGELVKATNDVSVAEGQLNLQLNRPLDHPVQAVHLDELAPVIISRENAEEIAKTNNNALKAARARKTTAMYQRGVVEADYYPNINLSSEYAVQKGQENMPPNMWSVMVKLDWSLLEWGGTNQKVGAAKAYERQMEYQINLLENQIASQIRNGFFLIEEADKRMEIDKEAIASAEENLRITQIGFAHGRKTSTDVMNAEDKVSKSRSRYIQDFYEALTARAQLRYLMGTMETESPQHRETLPEKGNSRG
jgi:outer membrane protein TolC